MVHGLEICFKVVISKLTVSVLKNRKSLNNLIILKASRLNRLIMVLKALIMSKVREVRSHCLNGFKLKSDKI